MDEIRGDKQVAKRRTPAWLRSLAGRQSEPVIIAKGICPQCEIIGPGVAYQKEIIFKHADPDPEDPDNYPTEVILFEGLKLKKCGHVIVFLVTDNSVRRHLEAVRKCLKTVQQYVGCGDLSSAQRADKKHKAATKRAQSASRAAWRKYESVAPKGLIPIEALLKKSGDDK
jgi:hypothetical protein